MVRNNYFKMLYLISGVDYCSMGHSCDENAMCMNLNTKYTCKCNQGFQGDGITCEGRELVSYIDTFRSYIKTYNFSLIL